MIEIYITSIILGLSVAAPIGPINIEIIRRGLTSGPLAAFALGCGAVSADCTYFGLSLLASRQAAEFVKSPGKVATVLFVGGGVLIWLGYGAIRAKSKINANTDEKKNYGSAIKGYFTGLAMTLANPMTIGLWLSIAASFTAASEEVTRAMNLVRLGGVGSGALSWVLFITSLLALSRRYITPKLLHWINVISGLIVVGFGLKFWLDAVRQLVE